jgi:uncharacterized Zn-binding protein involved in type VI secretion
MPQAARFSDYSSGHDACAPMPLEAVSDNVLINSRGAGREGDRFKSHGCDAHAPHEDVIISGSATVFINGKRAARKGDELSLAGVIADGSNDVYAGG